MVLHLSDSFRPIEGKQIAHESFFFSGGEPHIKITDSVDSDKVTITQRLNSFNDLGLLLVAVDALRRLGVKQLELFIPYFPAARQDRVMVKGEALTLKVYTDIINKLDTENVTIFDPHSDVTGALLNNCTIINNHTFIEKLVSQLPEDLILVSPDAGSLKKIYKLASHLKDYDVLECGKVRDVTSGALTGFNVPQQDLAGRSCLIVDDICDGGGTFLGLAKELKKQNTGDLYLAVSHGIFSKGSKALLENFKSIFTTDSIGESHTGINYISIKEII